MIGLVDLNSCLVKPVIEQLLQDKTTKKNIIWATDAYSYHGTGFQDINPIKSETLYGEGSVPIRSRTEKAIEEQLSRVKSKAEVFTPIWICNSMNNHCDKEWFGREGVFNIENENHTWTITEGKIEFPEKKTWKQYVDSRRIEITCGEAPFLVSRYDAATGELILPPMRRIGILDRKMRIVNENALDDAEWMKWSLRALQACYGYEYQGDSLLIARCNMLLSMCDYYYERFGNYPETKELKTYANVIAWNLWQMDGLKNTVPLGKPQEAYAQLSFFDTEESNVAPFSMIFNWRCNKSLTFSKLKEEKL